ncbi:hypothetical protein [uncultured Methanobrevibacter sp.]|uniref:hypothetical protein n=1 Tax=uncultured Methanobrevibacter sp. TaxID=253161 RepID=UPI002601FF26|nr:hypothetical protein [uncultured Methanobrevibacter sp.]
MNQTKKDKTDITIHYSTLTTAKQNLHIYPQIQTPLKPQMPAVNVKTSQLKPTPTKTIPQTPTVNVTKLLLKICKNDKNRQLH